MSVIITKPASHIKYKVGNQECEHVGYYTVKNRVFLKHLLGCYSYTYYISPLGCNTDTLGCNIRRGVMGTPVGV
jgi:hypothetical protein